MRNRHQNQPIPVPVTPDVLRRLQLALEEQIAAGGGGDGTGTVTSVSVVAANGVSGTVTNPTTAPAISLALGDITPTHVHVTPAAGNGILDISPGPGFVYTMIRMRGYGGMLSDGLEFLAGANGVYYSANNHVYRNAAQTVTYGTLNESGLAVTGAVTGSNLSGTNTGDETKSTIDAKIGATGGTAFYRKDGTWAAGGTGTVTTVSVTSSAGVSGSVANPTTAPAITITLGNIQPIDVTAGGQILQNGNAPLGYNGSNGAGGSVTQATSKATGVTLNRATGRITMNAASLAANDSVSFTLTNSVIASTDVVVVNIGTVATAASYMICVDAVANGSCRIHLRNVTAAALAQALTLNYAVFKGAVT